MAEAHLDHPDEISWYKGYGSAPVLGPCPHDCPHGNQSVIGWGPDMRRYEMVQCDELSGCNTTCRAWADGRGVETTDWLHVDWRDARRIAIREKHAALALDRSWLRPEGSDHA